MRLFGWIATLGFAISYLPQLIHTYKTKKVDDVSVALWWILVASYICGLAYGISLKEWPLIFGYINGFICTSLFLILYYTYKDK